MLRSAVLLLLVVGLSQQAKQFNDEDTCTAACIGDRDGSCRSTEDNTYTCTCQAQYFSDRNSCDTECDKVYYSWFTYGICATKVNTGTCAHTCGWRIRVWTTVLLLVLFLSACIIVVFLLPMCITSCRSCILMNKERKARKTKEYAEFTQTMERGGGTIQKEAPHSTSSLAVVPFQSPQQGMIPPPYYQHQPNPYQQQWGNTLYASRSNMYGYGGRY